MVGMPGGQKLQNPDRFLGVDRRPTVAGSASARSRARPEAGPTPASRPGRPLRHSRPADGRWPWRGSSPRPAESVGSPAPETPPPWFRCAGWRSFFRPAPPLLPGFADPGRERRRWGQRCRWRPPTRRPGPGGWPGPGSSVGPAGRSAGPGAVRPGPDRSAGGHTTTGPGWRAARCHGGTGPRPTAGPPWLSPDLLPGPPTAPGRWHRWPESGVPCSAPPGSPGPGHAAFAVRIPPGPWCGPRRPWFPPGPCAGRRAPPRPARSGRTVAIAPARVGSGGPPIRRVPAVPERVPPRTRMPPNRGSGSENVALDGGVPVEFVAVGSVGVSPNRLPASPMVLGPGHQPVLTLGRRPVIVPTDPGERT